MNLKQQWTAIPFCMLLMTLTACGGGEGGSGGSSSSNSSSTSSNSSSTSSTSSSSSTPTPIAVTDALQFSTQDQGLFGPGKPTKTTTFLPITLHNKSIGPATKGQIYKNVSQDVPVAVLQSAWDQALGACTTTRSVKAVNYCANYTFTPTQNQCQTGSVTLPSTATINCCGSLGVPDITATYPSCGLLGLKTNASVTIPANLRNYDLGAGIGPRPTQPAPEPFDVGLVTTYEASVNVGLEGSVTTDAGSLDVAYATTASLTANANRVAAGDTFTLTARHAPIRDTARTFMTSRYPNINFAFQYYLDLLAKLDVDYANMGTDGKQKRAQESIVSYSTANQPDADAQGRLVGELVGVQVGLNGLEARIFANQPSSFPVDFPAGITFDFPLSLGWDITTPFTCPIAGIPKLGSYVCGPPPILSTDVAEISVRTPALNTPAAMDFDGGVTDFGSLTRLLPLRNEVASDGSLSNTTPSAFREILSVPGLSGFNSLDDILLDDGRLSTDFARIDLDLDGLASLYQGGVNPLGGNFAFGGNTIDPATGQNKSVANMEWNMLDIDYANWFHVRQSLKFEPNLQVDLSFSKPVQVREGSGAFATVSAYSLNVAADSDAMLEIIQPAGGVTITPTYSLRNNQFSNDSDMLWTPALQESFLQVKVEGILTSLLASVLLPTSDDLNFAVAQSTQATPPVSMGSIGADQPYTLDGFQNVPGTPLTISE
jgi:hypothetical protein